MADTFSLIASYTVGSGGATSIDFVNIPNVYTDLVVKASIRTNRTTIGDGVYLKLNTSSANYSWRDIEGNGSSTALAGYTNTTNYIFTTNATNSTTSTFGNAEFYIPNYTGTNSKAISADSATENNGSDGTLVWNSALWSNTSAINAISLNPTSSWSFAQYSTAYLYGIKNS